MDTMLNLSSPRLALPAGPRGFVRPGHVDLLGNRDLMRKLGIVLGFGGSDKGFNTAADVVTQSADGTDLNTVWADFQATLDAYNTKRTSVVDFLTYKVSNPVESVMQAAGGDDFEIASEFGVPKGVRTNMTYFQMGFPFEWYDIATRYTWKFLLDATTAQIESIHNSIIEADNRNVFREVMSTLFDNTNRSADIENRAYTVYSLYNGTDGVTPPTFGTTTFTNTHSHYMVSGAATVDGGDLDALIDNIQEHGFSAERGAQLVVMVNKVEAARIRDFRSINNASAAAVTAGLQATYDFIPATGTPSLLYPKDVIVGTQNQPSPVYKGMKVIGSYGDALIVQEDYIPAGYMVAFATGGLNSLTNPLGIREHANTTYRGLRLVKARTADYPLQDSYYQRGFGVGIRQRGSAAIMQIKASGSYAPPTVYTR